MSLPRGEYGLDEVYLTTREYEEPKEAFKALIPLLRAARPGPVSILDVGCATGAFLHHAMRSLDVERAVGIDVFGPLLDQARRHVPEATFIELSLTDLADRLDERFGLVTCLGTATLFDDFDSVVRNLMSAVAPGGSCFVWEPVNEDPVDLLMRYRLAEGDDAWHPGFNIRSVRSWELAAGRVDPDLRVTTTDFRMPFAIAPTDDPMRAWTIATDADPHQLTVGTGQLLRFKYVRIARP